MNFIRKLKYNKMYLVINGITLVRIPLTIAFVKLFSLYLGSDKNRYVIMALIISILVLTSDYLDGKLARKNNVATLQGQRLDVFCDCIYIILTSLYFNWVNIIPYYYTIVVLLKFTEFITISRLIRYLTNEHLKGNYYYDRIGQIASGMYYILPSFIIILELALPNLRQDLINLYIIFAVCTTVYASFCKYNSYMLLTKGKSMRE